MIVSPKYCILSPRSNGISYKGIWISFQEVRQPLRGINEILTTIKERPDEYLDNPAESIRDEILSLTTLGARRAAINDAPIVNQIADETIFEDDTFTLTVSGSDVDDLDIINILKHL